MTPELPEAPETRRGPWCKAEDDLLMSFVTSQGPLNWVKIASHIRSRTPKQCRERYHQNLKPSLNHCPITAEEGAHIEKMVKKVGKRWAEIARTLSNRSDNAVKNWWNGSMNRRKRLMRKNAPSGYDDSHSSHPYSSQPPESPAPPPPPPPPPPHHLAAPPHPSYLTYSAHPAYPPGSYGPSSPASFPPYSFPSHQHQPRPMTYSGLPSPSTTSSGAEPPGTLTPLTSASGSKPITTPTIIPSSDLPRRPDAPIILPPLRIGKGKPLVSQAPVPGPTLPPIWQPGTPHKPVQLPSIGEIFPDFSHSSGHLPTAPNSPLHHSPRLPQPIPGASTQKGEANGKRSSIPISDLLT